MAKREKGWASAIKGRATATHYVGDGGQPGITTMRSACDRARLRVLERDLSLLPREVRARLRALEVCDWCQAARRKRA